MIRTTLSLEQELYQELKATCQDYGFRRFNDLVVEALREFLRRRKADEYNRLMEEASRCPQYQEALRDLSAELVEAQEMVRQVMQAP